MADEAIADGTNGAGPRARIPWHLWVVAVLSLLWNLGGPIDWVMTKTHNAAYLARMTPEQLAWMAHFPLWVEIAWAVGVWGAIGGSVLLLARSRYAVPVFVASLAGLIVSMAYQWGSGTMPTSLRTSGGAGFVAALFVVAIALVVYSQWMRARRALR